MLEPDVTTGEVVLMYVGIFVVLFAYEGRRSKGY